MIRDEDLRKATDYSRGQKDAAYSVLGEIVNLLEPFADDMRIIGGWVPSLLYPDKEHIGSIDVDVLLNQEKVQKKQGYATIKEILEKHGYCCINGFDGGIYQLTQAFIPHRDRELVKQMRKKLSEKFASPDHAGPTDIASFMDIRDPQEAALVRQDAYQKVRYLVEHLILSD